MNPGSKTHPCAGLQLFRQFFGSMVDSVDNSEPVLKIEFPKTVEYSLAKVSRMILDILLIFEF